MKIHPSVLLRFALGLPMTVAGSDKVIALLVNGNNGVQAWLQDTFAPEFMPEFTVTIAAYALPFVELLIGLSLVLGLRAKWGAYAGVALFGVFLMGTEAVHNQEGMIQEIIQQMVWLIAFYLLARDIQDRDALSVDRLLARTSATKPETESA